MQKKRLVKYVLIWVVGIVFGVALGIADKYVLDVLAHSEPSPDSRWIWTLIIGAARLGTALPLGLSFKWPFLWTLGLVALWLITNAAEIKYVPLNRRILYFLLWLFGTILLLPDSVGPNNSGAAQLSQYPSSLGDMLALVAIWTVAVFLIYLVVGDESRPPRTSPSTYGLVWSVLAIVLLTTLLTARTAYVSVRARVEGDQTARTMASNTVAQLNRGASWAAADARNFASSVADYRSNVAYYRQLQSSTPSALSQEQLAQHIAKLRLTLLDDLSQVLPALRQHTFSSLRNARGALDQVRIATDQAQGDDQKALEQVSDVLSAVITSTGELSSTVTTVGNAISTELAAVAAKQAPGIPGTPSAAGTAPVNAGYGGTDTLADQVQRDLQVQAEDTARMAQVAERTLTGIDANDLPTFLWIAVLYSVMILFPWVLLMLFLYRKQYKRAAQIAHDLVDLDPTYDLLTRVVSLNGTETSRLGWSGLQRRSDNNNAIMKSINYLRNSASATQTSQQQGPERTNQVDDGEGSETVTQMNKVIERLAEHTFSNFEFVLSILLLNTVTAVGWYFIFYPKGSLLMAALMEQGAGIRELADSFVNNASPLTLGFAGAYFFVLQMLFRRYLSDDLYPSAFLQAAVRLLVVFIISLGLTVMFGTGDVPNGAAACIAFLVGIYPPKGLSMLASFANKALHKDNLFPESIEEYPLTDLAGIDLWTEARLLEENLENVESMATVEIEQLVLGTRYPTQRIVDWVDEAILRMHAGYQHEWLPVFEKLGINGASKLLYAAGLNMDDLSGRTAEPPSPDSQGIKWLVKAANGPIVEGTANTNGTAASGSTSANADGAGLGGSEAKLTGEIVYEICKTAFCERNLKYILNFRYSTYHRKPQDHSPLSQAVVPDLSEVNAQMSSVTETIETAKASTGAATPIVAAAVAATPTDRMVADSTLTSNGKTENGREQGG